VNLPALTVALFCFFTTPKLVNAQLVNGHSLSDLKRIQILVEELSDSSKKMGLTSDSLYNKVLVALKRDIPKLKINRAAQSFIHVQITTAELDYNQGFAVTVKVSILRPAKVIGDGAGETYVSSAEVWNLENLITGPPSNTAERVLEQVNEDVTAFVAQYYRDNP
jgi:hypothetical protein